MLRAGPATETQWCPKDQEGCPQARKHRPPSTQSGLLRTRPFLTPSCPQCKTFSSLLGTFPNVRFQWFKAGREIYESDKCSIRSSHYISSLEILRTQVVDCGEYTCKASNEYGSVSCTATLTVTGKWHTLNQMLSSHFILLPNLFFIQVQEVLVLATGETSIQDGNMVVRYYVGLEIIIYSRISNNS